MRVALAVAISLFFLQPLNAQLRTDTIIDQTVGLRIIKTTNASTGQVVSQQTFTTRDQQIGSYKIKTSGSFTRMTWDTLGNLKLSVEFKKAWAKQITKHWHTNGRLSKLEVFKLDKKDKYKKDIRGPRKRVSWFESGQKKTVLKTRGNHQKHITYRENGSRILRLHLLFTTSKKLVLDHGRHGEKKYEPYSKLWVKIGRWKYWDTNNRLLKTEKWGAGGLIHTKEAKRD